jgi:hypothetical protein
MSKLLGERTISSKLTETTFEQRATHKGMAHFAGTGPRGLTCRECIFWDHWKGDYRKKDGLIKPAPCKKYQQLRSGERGNDVPDDAAACKYFEFNQTAPEKYQR